jgi:cytoskeletal protein CcmA (bactofilin family)
MEHHRGRLTLLLALMIWLVALPVAADLGSTALVGQSFVLEAGQRLNGDVAIFAGNAEIAQGAIVTGDVAVIGGSARIYGTVEGDAVVLGGSMTLGPQAWVKGDVVAMGTLERDPGARVSGSVVAGSERSRQLEEVRQSLQEQGTLPDVITTRPVAGRTNTWFGDLVRWAAGVLGLAVVAVALLAIQPEAVQHISEVMRRSVVLSIAVGVVTLLASVLLVPLLIVIIVGIPVAIVLVIGLALALLCGWVAAARLAGSRLLTLLKTASSSAILEAVVGVVVLALLGRIPCLGALFSLAVACWGLGAVVLTRFGTSQDLIWAPFEPLAATAGMAGQPPPTKAGSAGDAPEQRRAGDTRELSPWDLDDKAPPID